MKINLVDVERACVGSDALDLLGGELPEAAIASLSTWDPSTPQSLRFAETLLRSG